MGDYILWLREQNAVCTCPELQELHKQKIKVNGLEIKCGDFKSSLDFKRLSEKDEKSLEDYRKAIVQLDKEVKEYYSQMKEYGKIGLIHFTLHDIKEEIPLRNITYSEAIKKLNEKQLVTIHCSECRQQLDIAV